MLKSLPDLHGSYKAGQMCSNAGPNSSRTFGAVVARKWRWKAWKQLCLFGADSDRIPVAKPAQIQGFQEGRFTRTGSLEQK